MSRTLFALGWIETAESQRSEVEATYPENEAIVKIANLWLGG